MTDSDENGVETVTLDGSGSFDVDGEIVSYVWMNGSDDIGTGATLAIDFPIGIHTVTLTVVDNENASDTDVLIVTVLEVDRPPVKLAQIGDFVIFGSQSLTMEPNTLVISGDAGSNGAADLGENAEVPVAGSSLVADQIVMGNNALVANAYYNNLQNNGGEIYGEQGTVTTPVVSDLPTIPDFFTGAFDVEVGSSQAIILPAGSYDDLVVADNGTLILTDGGYNFSSISVGADALVIFRGSVDIRVAGNVFIGEDTYVGPSVSTSLTAQDIVMYVAGTDAQLANDVVMIGNIYAPNGTLRLGENSFGQGAFIGLQVILANGAEVQYASAFGATNNALAQSAQPPSPGRAIPNAVEWVPPSNGGDSDSAMDLIDETGQEGRGGSSDIDISVPQNPSIVPHEPPPIDLGEITSDAPQTRNTE